MSRIRMPSFAAITVAFLLLAACSKPHASSQRFSAEPSLGSVLLDSKASWAEKRAYFLATTLESPDWHKHWWIEKTARLLRGGAGIGPGDDVTGMMKLGEAQIIRQFMADDRFGDTLLDFNMYFLGFKNNSLLNKDPSTNAKYSPGAFDLANAVTAAQEGIKGGDYFKLFDLLGPTYPAPLGTASVIEPIDSILTPRQRREKYIGKIEDDLRAADLLANKEGVSTVEVCLGLRNQNQLLNNLFGLGYPILTVFNGPLIDMNWYTRLEIACSKVPAPPVEDIARIIEDIMTRNEAFFGELESFEIERYNPSRVADFRPLNAKVATMSERALPISFEQTQALQNSSTNFDRKRAAYVLKHYFCDDLNPVGVENPTAHTGGPHGSETSCAACHYKLDPMAGFFRDYGFFFSDFSKNKNITFDDQTNSDRAKYVSAWKAPAGSGRNWEVGYIRSSSASPDNEYGESIDDLSKIIRNAPEAKRCLVKRLFEYFVAENQSVDAGYLRFLSDSLASESAASSSAEGVKNTIARLVMSNGFNEGNLDPQKCYDSAPGGGQTDAPPCRVAFLLQSYCADCHHAAGDQKFGGLDLTKWIQTADGSMSFPHENMLGQQLATRESFTKIVERLSTSDPDHRMPLKKAMPSQDRQELFLWAQAILNNGVPFTGAKK
jgi:hypothetical protein